MNNVPSGLDQGIGGSRMAGHDKIGLKRGSPTGEDIDGWGGTASGE